MFLYLEKADKFEVQERVDGPCTVFVVLLEKVKEVLLYKKG